MDNQISGSHPLIPVMRNTKLPLILVQLTNLWMLLESTVWAVCRLAVPIPSHAGVHSKTAQHTSKISSNKDYQTARNPHLLSHTVNFTSVGEAEIKLVYVYNRPLGQMSVQGMHILMPFSSTSILLLGHALTQELWSTTKLSETQTRCECRSADGYGSSQGNTRYHRHAALAVKSHWWTCFPWQMLS